MPDILKLSSIGKSIGKDSAGDWVDFDLPRCFPSSALESEIEPADSGKEASKCEFFCIRFIHLETLSCDLIFVYKCPANFVQGSLFDSIDVAAVASAPCGYVLAGETLAGFAQGGQQG